MRCSFVKPVRIAQSRWNRDYAASLVVGRPKTSVSGNKPPRIERCKMLWRRYLHLIHCEARVKVWVLDLFQDDCS
jgi:hypothetical protein